MLYSANHQDISFEIQLKRAEDGFFFGGFNPQYVEEVQESFQRMIRDKKLPGEVLWYGNGFFQLEMKRGIDKINALNGLVILIVFVLFKIFYGSYSSSFLYIFTLGLCSIFLNGMLGLTKTPVDILSNSFFILLTISCIEDFIFLSHFRRKLDSDDWTACFKKILVPSFLTSITTIIGFGSLYFTELQIVSRFGLMAAFGAFVEWTMMFTFLPSFLVLFPKLTNWVKSGARPVPELFQKLGKQRPHKLITWGMMIFYPALFLLIGNIEVDDTPENVFPSSHYFNDTRAYFEKERGWKAAVSLLFYDKKNTELIDKVLAHVRDDKTVVKIEDSPSVKNYFLTPLKGDWSIESLGQRLLDRSPLWERLISDKYARAELMINDMTIKNVDRLKREVAKFCPEKECEIGGSLVSFGEFSQKIPDSLLQSLAMSLILVSIVISLVAYFLGHSKLIIPLILSALWGPIASLSVIILLGLKITYMTCIFASVLVGLAGDNALQYLFAASENSLEEGVDNCFQSSYQVCLFMFLLPIVFMISPFVPMRELGVLFSMGSLASLFGDLWLLRGLIPQRSRI
jgi:predicted RND superfamily exporter protein